MLVPGHFRRLYLYVPDLGHPGALAHQLNKLIDLVLVAFEKPMYPAIIEVLDVSPYPEHHGVPAGERPEPDGLHSA